MRIIKRILIALLSLMLIVGCSGIIATNYMMDSMLEQIDQQEEIKQEEAEIAPEVIEQVKQRNVINIALFGADNSKGIESTSEERSDVMKIVSLDYDHKKIKITSLERDVVVYIPGEHQEYGHFNWAYWFGGPELAVKTINYNLDLDITQYVTLNFRSVIELIDLIGGVDISLTKAEATYFVDGHIDHNAVPGINHMNGEVALSYARLREIDSNFNRMERQNNVIRAVITKLKDKSATELMEIVKAMMPYITTNLSNEDIKEYMMSLLSFDLMNIETYTEPSGKYNDIARCPGLGGYLVRSYSDMVKSLHKNIYGDEEYVPSQTVIDNEKRTYETYGEFKK